MNISPVLMLTVGSVAAFLFVAVFAISAFITARNRRTIRKHAAEIEPEKR